MTNENFEVTVIDSDNQPHESLTQARRPKRTEAEMIASLGGTLEQAMYLKRRVQKLEEKIAELFAGVSVEATELVLKGSEHLGRYLP